MCRYLLRQTGAHNCGGLLVAREHHVRTRKLISVKCFDFYENKGSLPLLIANYGVCIDENKGVKQSLRSLNS